MQILRRKKVLRDGVARPEAERCRLRYSSRRVIDAEPKSVAASRPALIR